MLTFISVLSEVIVNGSEETQENKRQRPAKLGGGGQRQRRGRVAGQVGIIGHVPEHP